MLGYNANGRLGYGDTSNRGDGGSEMGSYLPNINVGPNVLVVNVESGGYHNTILTDSGEMKSWGFNAYGQLGYGDTSNRGDNGNEINLFITLSFSLSKNNLIFFSNLKIIQQSF